MTASTGHRLLLIFLVGAALLQYLPHLDAYFVKDDFSLAVIAKDHETFNLEGFWQHLIWPTERTWDDIWRPVPAMSWALDVASFGPDPVIFHLVNVLIHALNGILVYWLLGRLTGFVSPAACGVGALLFVIWPLQGEAVMWSTQRTVLLGLFFSLLAILAYHVWLSSQKRRHFLLAWIAFALGSLSREHALTVPASFAVMTLFSGPKRTLRDRLRELVQMGVVGVLLIAVYFGCRYLIFDRLVGGYSGWPTQEAYSEHHRVFARLPETLRYCLAPANRALLSAPALGSITWAMAYEGVLVLGLLGVVVNLITGGLRRPSTWCLLAIVLVFSLTAWLPVGRVFFVENNLMNSRSGYHLVALLVAFFGYALANPWSREPGRGRVTTIALVGLVVLSSATVLAHNLKAYRGGGDQTRAIQVDTANRLPSDSSVRLAVGFDIPTEFKGCPTLDQYFAVFLSPPFLRDHTPGVPFVAGLKSTYGAHVLNPEGPWSRSSRHTPSSSRVFLWCRGDPPGAQPVFEGGPFVQEGQFPIDGEIAVVDIRGHLLMAPHIEPPQMDDDADPVIIQDGLGGAWVRRELNQLLGSAPEEITATVRDYPTMTFAASCPEGTHRGALVIRVPDRELRFPFKVGEHARLDENRVFYDPSKGSRDPLAPLLPWPLPPVFYNPVLFLQWHMEFQDEKGAVLGNSPASRLVLIDGSD